MCGRRYGPGYIGRCRRFPGPRRRRDSRAERWLVARHGMLDEKQRTETSTILIQKVLPTRSLARTMAPCKPVYCHLLWFGYAMYSLATATAWILLEALGTCRLTFCLSSSFRMDGMVRVGGWAYVNPTVTGTGRGKMVKLSRQSSGRVAVRQSRRTESGGRRAHQPLFPRVDRRDEPRRFRTPILPCCELLPNRVSTVCDHYHT